MARHINIEPREHVERRVSMTAEQGSAYTVATGTRESYKLTGTWEDMLAAAATAVGEGGSTMAISCEVERLEGGLGELTITQEEYREPTAEEEDPADSGLGSAEHPQYSSSSDTQPAPLLTHPLFAGISDGDLMVLKELMDGAVMDSVITTSSGARMTLRAACSALTGPAGVAARYLYKGVKQYLEVHAEATARWKGTTNQYAAGEICTPPNAPRLAAGRNWLCVGTGTEKQGTEVWQTARFKASGPGGWDTVLYGS